MSELAEIKRLLQRLVSKFELIYPNLNDADATYADTLACAGETITTLTLSFTPEWRIVVNKLYVDAEVDCTAEWFYKGKKVTGNEIEFTKRQLFSRPEQVVLKITNIGTSAQYLDVLVKAFGRLIPEGESE